MNLESQIKFVGNILRHEYLKKEREKDRPTSESVAERLDLLTRLGEINISDNKIEKVALSNTPHKFSFIGFFNVMGNFMVDTYLIVLMAV